MNTCIEGVGATNAYGYHIATIRVGARRYGVLAHRFAVDVPQGMVVRHTCDNPGCVNPEHLRIGTQADNLRDASERGRVRNGNIGKSHCVRGHEFTPENTYRYGSHRACKACKIERQRIDRLKAETTDEAAQ